MRRRAAATSRGTGEDGPARAGTKPAGEARLDRNRTATRAGLRGGRRLAVGRAGFTMARADSATVRKRPVALALSLVLVLVLVLVLAGCSTSTSHASTPIA